MTTWFAPAYGVMSVSRAHVLLGAAGALASAQLSPLAQSYAVLLPTAAALVAAAVRAARSVVDLEGWTRLAFRGAYHLTSTVWWVVGQASLFAMVAVALWPVTRASRTLAGVDAPWVWGVHVVGGAAVLALGPAVAWLYQCASHTRRVAERFIDRHEDLLARSVPISVVAYAALAYAGCVMELARRAA